jgi:hypothetical protein
VALFLPFPAATAELLFDAARDSVAILKSQVLPDGTLAILPPEFALILCFTILAPNLQAIRSGTIFVKIAFRLPVFTHRASLLLHAIYRSMASLVVIVLSHRLSQKNSIGPAASTESKALTGLVPNKFYERDFISRHHKKKAAGCHRDENPPVPQHHSQRVE